MIRFEKKGRSHSLGIVLRKKAPFFTPELIRALGAVLAIHLLFYLLFSPQSSLPEGTRFSPGWVDVASGSVFFEKEVDLFLPEPTHLKNIVPPPSSDWPSLLAALPPLKEEPSLEPKEPAPSESVAMIRGLFPQRLKIPLFHQPILAHEKGILSFRSDSKGQIFWMEWLDKTSRPALDKEIESWVKGLKLSEESAFTPQILEIRLSP